MEKCYCGMFLNNYKAQAPIRGQGLPWSSGQGAIEYLLIIGAAILVVAIVIIAITSVLSQGQNQTSTGIESASSAVDSLKETSGAYVRLNNHYYLKSDSIAQNIVALWHFDETSGNIAIDSSGNNKNGTIVGGMILTEGIAGSKAFRFNGSDAKVSVDTGLIGNNLTISLWLRATDYSTIVNYAVGLIRTKSDRQSPPYFNIADGIYIAPRGVGVLTQQFGWRDHWSEPALGHSNADIYSSSNYFLSGDTYHNYIFVKNGKIVNVYRDGSPFGSDSFDTATDWTPGITDIGLAGCNGCSFNRSNPSASPVASSYFKGDIDEVIVWNKALSASDVNALYNNALS